jgi:tetratricopeptide (TPR) repeat protein
VTTTRQLAILLGCAWMFVSAHAGAEDAQRANDVARAESYASSAFDAYAQGEYETAVELYEKALEAAPSADILYNLARIYDTKLKDRSRAIDYYRRYSTDTGADPERMRVVGERLALLEAQQRVASTPAATRPAPVTPSPPPAEAAHAAAPAPAPAPPSAPARPSGLGALAVVGIASGSVGLAGLGLGIGFGLEAKAQADDADRDCDGNACRTQHGLDASREAARAATISTVSFIAGGALTALGITFLIVGSGDDAAERETASLSLVPYADARRAGAMLSGRW